MFGTYSSGVKMNLKAAKPPVKTTRIVSGMVAREDGSVHSEYD